MTPAAWMWAIVLNGQIVGRPAHDRDRLDVELEDAVFQGGEIRRVRVVADKPRPVRMSGRAGERRALVRSPARMSPISSKRQRERSAFDRVYAQVDRRSGIVCEAHLPARHPATERHHLFKPRRGTCERCGIHHLPGHHRAENILAVCSEAHGEFEPRPYAKGRRVPTTFDPAANRWQTEIVWAPDKFAARSRS